MVLAAMLVKAIRCQILCFCVCFGGGAVPGAQAAAGRPRPSAPAVSPVTGTAGAARMVALPDELRNATHVLLTPVIRVTPWDDATWILTSAFIIFTMQSGFGLLESGSVSKKNEVNIMVKNAVDVLFGGISYWMFGYGLSFDKIMGHTGEHHPFVGVGEFLVDETDPEKVGHVFSHFFFHASFATTATTIVSGAMAERTKLEAYILFSFLNTIVYCFPEHWMWDEFGWLRVMGTVDIAGAGAVHLVGGVTGLVATLMLKPRTGHFQEGAEIPAMGSPTNALFGMFMLWWGWLGFNCGSTYGISNKKWILAARSATCTITASIGGGMTAIVLSYLLYRRKFNVGFIINGVLGSLVSITAMCALAHPWQGLVIGIVGSSISCCGCVLTERVGIDDPVSVVPVHALAATWSLIAVGIFGRKDPLADNITTHDGLLAGGGFKLLGVQLLAIVTIAAWAATVSAVILKLIDVTLGLRVPLHEEILGADLVEHSLGGRYDKLTGEWRDRHGQLIAVVRPLQSARSGGSRPQDDGDGGGGGAGDAGELDARLLRRLSARRRRMDSAETKSAFGFVRREEAAAASSGADDDSSPDADDRREAWEPAADDGPDGGPDAESRPGRSEARQQPHGSPLQTRATAAVHRRKRKRFRLSNILSRRSFGRTVPVQS